MRVSEKAIFGRFFVKNNLQMLISNYKLRFLEHFFLKLLHSKNDAEVLMG